MYEIEHFKCFFFSRHDPPRIGGIFKSLGRAGGSLTRKGWGLASISKVCRLGIEAEIEDWVKGWER